MNLPPRTINEFYFISSPDYVKHPFSAVVHTQMRAHHETPHKQGNLPRLGKIKRSFWSRIVFQSISALVFQLSRQQWPPPNV